MNIYFRLTDSSGGANVIVDSIRDELEHTGHSCALDYLPRSIDMFPFFGPLFADRSANPDVVHGDVFSAFYRTNKPFVFTFHHVVHDRALGYKSIAQRIYHTLLYWYEKRALRNADAVICPSRFTRSELERVFSCRDARVIYNGVDTEVFKPGVAQRERYGIPGGKTLLLFTGNLLRRKGADLLPAIMQALGDDYLLLLTCGMRGGGQLQIKNSLNLGSVPFEQLPGIYNLCELLLFPTRLEGFGFTVAEAMACGKPVVTTNCSALPELVVHGENGLLCEMDNTADFVAAVTQLRASVALCRTMGSASRQRAVERFEKKRMVTQYIALYQELRYRQKT